MLSSTAQLAAIALALAPSLVSAAIFPKDSIVKMLDPKGFRQVMKANQTSMVAFVAPWCGHCQRMVPEYSKAAKGLAPLIPVYAVDCDAEENKRLCADQGVKGFPTVKLFPRGAKLGSMTYESGERTANGFFNWASRRVPNTVAKFPKAEDIKPWVEKTVNKNRALLLTKDTKVPLLWKVLSNKYKDQLDLGTHRDRDGKSSVAMGLEAGGEKQAKVLIYPAGSTKFVRYEGVNKLDALSKFFDSVLDGTADLSNPNEETKKEDVPLPKEATQTAEGTDAGNDTPEQTQEAVKVKQAVPPAGGKCDLAEDGPGAEPPVECTPPVTPDNERPKDEL